MSDQSPAIEPRDTDERDRWLAGLVRHLRRDDTVPAGTCWAVRISDGRPLDEGGYREVYYTLVINPADEPQAETWRARAEGDPGVGGLFSPGRDLS